MVQVKSRPKLCKTIGCTITAVALSAIMAVPAFALTSSQSASVNLTVRDDRISVTAPTSIPVSMNAGVSLDDGKSYLSFPSDMKIVNNTLIPVYVTGISATAKQPFTFVENDDALPDDVRKTCMVVNANVAISNGGRLKNNEVIPINHKISSQNFAQVSGSGADQTIQYYNTASFGMNGYIVRHGLSINEQYSKDKAISPFAVSLKFSTDDPSATPAA